MDVDQRPWIDRPQGAAVSLSWARALGPKLAQIIK
jgi:hypothetical protein